MINLLMIPGLLCDEALFQPVITAFNNEYSIQVADAATPSSIEDCAKSISQNLDRDVILIGFSYGAWVALHLYPQIINYCRGIVLISSAPGNLSANTKERFEHYIREIEAGNFDKFVNDDFEYDTLERNKTKNPIKQNYMAMVYRQGKDVAIRQLKSIINYQGENRNFTEIRCPVLLIRGAADQSLNIPKHEKMLAEMPKAELAIIPDAAHYVPLENPQATSSAIEAWLAKSYSV